MFAISVVWCELGYYYFIFASNCAGWPGPQAAGETNHLKKILVISDTHIMGPVRSWRIDKIRREWQMQQAFWISNSIYKPEVIIFLGDILDEGSFSHDDSFDRACDDFDRIFAYNQKDQERIIIAGNHDIGFHDQMIYFPYLKRRFVDRYQVEPSIGLVSSSKLKGLNIVAINSMSFENDGCAVCSYSIASTDRLARQLNASRTINPGAYSAPILLTHIPLYRYNDAKCVYPYSMTQRVAKENIEGKDVLNRKESKLLLTKLSPRLVLSGHTHMQCLTNHSISGVSGSTTNELTITSYNHKYAETKPGFLLLSANSTHIFTRHCNLVEEWIIVSVYMATILFITSRMVLANRNRSPREYTLDG